MRRSLRFMKMFASRRTTGYDSGKSTSFQPGASRASGSRRLNKRFDSGPFLVRFLYPMVRIKIPAIVHMEILVMADRYFSWRRSTGKGIHSAATLLDHVTSQGSQRALLRLELQTDVEIERPRIGADPLRGVVQ